MATELYLTDDEHSLLAGLAIEERATLRAVYGPDAEFEEDAEDIADAIERYNALGVIFNFLNWDGS